MGLFTTIRGKYTLAFSVMSAVFLVVVVGTYLLVSYLQYNVGRYAPGVSLIQNADRDLYQSRLALSNLVYDPAHSPALAEDARSNARQAFERMESFRQMAAGLPQVQQLLGDFDAFYRAWQQSSEEVMALQGTDLAKASALLAGANSQHFSRLRGLYDKSEELITAIAADEKAQSNAYADSFKKVVLVLAGLVLLSSISLAWLAPRNIALAINKVTRGVREISSGDGDLSRRINNKAGDETGELSREVDEFVGKLAGLIMKVKAGCDGIRSEMGDIGKGADQSADLSDKQNQSLELIVTAIEQMSAATREVAQNATGTVTEVEQLASMTRSGMASLDNSTSQLQELSLQISDAAEVINALSASSERIISVLDVIVGIAEQTNLLALNAAIEAARAGEQGRGFAVVADEVRTLASRTQASTTDIQAMINELQNGVGKAVSAISANVTMARDTVEHTEAAKAALERVQGASERIYDLSAQTASAVEEQSKVAETINENLSELAQMSGRIKEISSKVSQSVQQTLSNSNQLAGQVKRFSV